jgi:type VI secretion system ImpH/TssG family protein
VARKDRPETHDLMDWSGQDEALARSSPFAVLRLAEATEHAKPKLGKARRPALSIVDLAQVPHLGFAPKSLENVEQRYGRPQLRGYWLGLTGPMGPLPTHLTEFAIYERRYAKKRPFGDWLDVLAGRMLQLFYRAWADSQPAAQADRSVEDQFYKFLGALSGAAEGARANSVFFERARAHYASLFSGLRSAVALQDSLSHLLAQPVEVEEFLPKWRELEPEDQSRLGRSYCTLGGDALVGKRVYSAADAFRVRVRARSYRDYLSLMPGGDRFSVASEALDAFKPTHLEWSLWVELDEQEIAPAQLDGRSRLGWHAWMKRGETKRKSGAEAVSGSPRADAHLTRGSIARRTKAA